MRCKFCLFENPEEVERCHRCGIRLSGDITFDGISLAGATALAPRRRRPGPETGSDGGAPIAPGGTYRGALASADRQALLFSGELSSNVIPFESFQRPAGKVAPKAEAPRNPAPRSAAKQLAAPKQTNRRQSSGRRASDRRSSDSGTSDGRPTDTGIAGFGISAAGSTNRAYS